MRYRNRHSLICEGLDRCLTNVHWLHLFPEDFVLHLPKNHSYHTPLLLSLTRPTQNILKPFRVESIWCNHGDFSNLIRHFFKEGTDFTRPTLDFEYIGKTKNNEVFGDIFQKKKHILARLAGIQKSHNYPTSSFLHNLEQSHTSEFSSILIYKNQFWMLKFRINWPMEGYRSTKFFHTFSLNKRIWNNISSLHENVVFLHEQTDIKKAIISFYTSLFTINQ